MFLCAAYIFINLIISLFLMFFVIKENDTCFINITMYLIFCVWLTPLIGIFIYKTFLRG